MKKFIKILCIILIIIIAGASIAYPTVIAVRGDLKDVPEDTEAAATMMQDSAMSERAYATDARIMTINLLAHYESFGGTDALPRASKFINMCEAYKPDVIGLQEMCDQWYCCIMKNKGNYKMIRPLTTGVFVRMTALIYNTDTLRLLKSGELEYENCDDPRLRRVVWGVFENISTGAVFAVTNTHFNLLRYGLENEDYLTMESQAKEQLGLTKQIAAENNCPVFSVGDFNCRERDLMGSSGTTSTGIYTLLASELTDVKNTAKRRVHGSQQDFDSTSIDHIFLYGDAEISRYTLLSQKYLNGMSDHYPLFADIRLR